MNVDARYLAKWPIPVIEYFPDCEDRDNQAAQKIGEWEIRYEISVLLPATFTTESKIENGYEVHEYTNNEDKYIADN